MLDYVIFAVTFVVFLILSVIYLYPGSKKTTTIPGPEPVDPLEGNLPDIVACESMHEFLVKIHADYGTIASFWYGPRMCISVASPKLLEEHSAAFDRPYDLYKGLTLLLGEETVVLANGADGRRRNALYSKTLSLSSVEKVNVFNKLSQYLVGRWQSCPKDEYIPVMSHMYHFSIKAFLQSEFGMDEVPESLIKTVKASFDVCWSDTEKLLVGDWLDSGSPQEKRFTQHKENLEKVIRSAMEHRKGSKNSDDRKILIDAVLDLDVPDSTKLSDLLTFFIFGFHKTALVLTWSIYFLAAHEEIQDKVRSEISKSFHMGDEITSSLLSNLKYLQLVIQEAIRMGVIIPYSAWIQDFDTVLGGHKIPAGTPVVHAMGVMMTDESIFSSPDSFDPERFNEENKKLLPLTFEPFGTGKRRCPGSSLALVQCTLLLSLLLKNFKIDLAPDQVALHEYGLMTKPKDEVWITALPLNK